MKMQVIGRLAMAIARIIVYVLTGVQLGGDGKEVIPDEAPAVEEAE